jgi:predicted TIM-barrel fold metal-dependent hydrolase
VWEYPFPEAQRLIESLRGRFGAEKLVWGSDMPNVERFATYRQTVDYVRRHCPGLSSRDKDRILGENVAELLGLGARGAGA